MLETQPVEGLVPQAAIEIAFEDAYAADPMGLVAFAPYHRLFTSGSETWDVWICTDPAMDSLGLDLSTAVTALNGVTADYFEEISEGRYRPVFRGAGTASVDACGIDQPHDTTVPRLYVDDFSVISDGSSSEVGKGGPGTISWTTESLLYEGISRRAEVDGATVVEIAAYEFSPAGSIAAHEMGHTFHWAHPGADDPYDNELDVMSLGWGGTNAFNLYAAGWIEPEQVALHHGGDRTYRVGTVGMTGTRMVVITTGEEGFFYALSVRGPDDPVLDANSPVSVDALGVEVYRVDQREDACSPLPADSPCFGILADISPVPAVAAPYPDFPQFHRAGTSFTVAGVPVTVSAATATSVDVLVEGGLTDSGWFLDDDLSVFEGDIEWVAGEGITKGCNPPRGDFFCPDEAITRGQMAAFLVRTLGLPASGTDAFSDDETSVFENDINALAASGITTGCTTTAFCPDDPVTRGQMAAFLKRAYTLQPSGDDVFSDDETSVFENDINALAASGITTGCTTTAFCPDDPVTRGQMAAFLRRAERL